MSTLPVRSPHDLTASSVPCHGVHSATTSLPATAASLVVVGDPRSAYLASSGERTPYLTSWSALHAPPRARPTLPAPMIAIFMGLRYGRKAVSDKNAL